MFSHWSRPLESSSASTGLSQDTRAVILEELKATHRKTCPFSKPPVLHDDFHEVPDIPPQWVKPSMVVDVPATAEGWVAPCGVEGSEAGQEAGSDSPIPHERTWSFLTYEIAMSDTLAQSLHNWQNFYILVGGAAATLVGLMFVAISLGSRLITERSVPALRVWVHPTLIHFIYVLVIATIIMVPTLTRSPLGILLIFAGLLSFGNALRMVPYMWQQQREQEADRGDWVWYLIVPSIIYLLFVGTGIGLLLGDNRALNVLAFAIILLLVNGIRNAWDMVVWITIKTESPPQ